MIRLRLPAAHPQLPLRQALSQQRAYATQTSLGATSQKTDHGRRQRVTVFNDDGRTAWGALSTGEKIARTTQQSFNFTLIAGGAAATLAVFVLLYTDVLSPDSTVTQYNHAVDRVRSDQRAIDLLGPSREISAVGDGTGTSWKRQRPRGQVTTDKFGTETLRMRFPVEGPKGKGMVDLYMVRRKDESHFHYGHLNLNIPGQDTIKLEEDIAKKSSGFTFMGIKWS